MTEKEQLEVIFQEYLDLELPRGTAKQCTLIAINVMINYCVTNALEEKYEFWNRVKKLGKDIEP